MTKRNQDVSFEQILLQAIDEALTSSSENVKTSIYLHFEESFKVKRQDIPQKLDAFLDELERIFGPDTRHTETLFIKSLHEKIGVTCKLPEHELPLCKWIIPEITFQEYIRLTQQNFEVAQENHMEMGVISHEHEEIQK